MKSTKIFKMNFRKVPKLKKSAKIISEIFCFQRILGLGLKKLKFRVANPIFFKIYSAYAHRGSKGFGSGISYIVLRE